MSVERSSHVESPFSVKFATFLLAVVSMALFIDTLAYGLIVPIVPSYAYTLGASDLEIGIIFAAFPVVELLTMLPIGALSDRYGKKPFIIIGLVSLVISTVAFATSGNVPQLILTRGLQGFAASCTMTAGLALISDGTSSDKMGGSLGIATAAQGAGLMAGPLVGGALVEMGGYTFPFIIAAVLATMISMLTVIALRGFRPQQQGKVARERFNWGEVLKDRTLFAIILIVAIWALGFGFLEPAYPLYLSESFGATATMIGIFFTAMSIPNILSQPLFGRLSDRIGRKKMVVVAALLFAVLFSLMAMAKSFVMLLPVAALLGLVSGMLFAPSLPLMIDTLSKRWGNGQRVLPPASTTPPTPSA